MAVLGRNAGKAGRALFLNLLIVTFAPAASIVHAQLVTPSSGDLATMNQRIQAEMAENDIVFANRYRVSSSRFRDIVADAFLPNADSPGESSPSEDQRPRL